MMIMNDLFQNKIINEPLCIYKTNNFSSRRPHSGEYITTKARFAQTLLTKHQAVPSFHQIHNVLVALKNMYYCFIKTKRYCLYLRCMKKVRCFLFNLNIFYTNNVFFLFLTTYLQLYAILFHILKLLLFFLY